MSAEQLILFSSFIKEFIQYLEKTFPGHPAVSQMKSDVLLMVDVHPQKLKDIFEEYIQKPYGVMIQECDVSFVKELEERLQGTSFASIGRLWDDAQEERQKASILLHLQKLCHVCN